MGRGKVPFFEGTPGNRYSEDGVGPVAQRIRARGYEPRCRGFKSLLAQPSVLPPALGIENLDSDSELRNLVVGLLSKSNGLFFFVYRILI